MQSSIKSGLFIFLFAVLSLPMVQQYFPLVKSGGLNGYFATAPNIEFSWSKWMNSYYQDSTTRYLNDNTGFRADLIRINNQIDFSLFDKVHSEWRILEGKHNTAYQDVYIYAYTGRDYIGYDSIYHRMKKLRAIQDTLERLGKTVLLIHAPNKAYFYPEDIPDELAKTRSARTNLNTYLRVGDSIGIHQADFNGWFMSMKSISKELLYPRQGFHWSVYGSWLAADSLARYIEQTRNIHMRRPVMGNISHTTKAQDTDDDLVKGFNIIFPVTTETFSYPDIAYSQDTTRPRVIYIGDSFLFTWMNSGFMDNTNAQWQIWYYFRYLLNSSNRAPEQTPLGDMDWVQEIEHTDCVILMYTSRNLAQMGDGFIEQAYAHYYPKVNSGKDNE